MNRRLLLFVILCLTVLAAACQRAPQKTSEIPRVLKHFLSRIARNLAFDRLDYITAKRRDVHMITLLSELDACLPDPHADVEAAVDAKLAAGSVNRFLSQLDKKDCAVFLSRYYYSMTIAEIADKLGLTERNVK